MTKFLLVAVVLSAIAFGCSQAAEDLAAPEPSPTQAAPDDGGAAGAMPEGGSTVAASCVETYSLETLAKRDYAFDGTITKIERSAADEPDAFTFAVEAWYHGGSGETAVRQGSSYGGLTSADGSEKEVGDRLLVAGDDDFAWDCGFTQPYKADVAADWERAF